MLDDLSTGHADAVPDGARLVEGPMTDAAGAVLADGPAYDGVLHFAAKSLVGESVEHPERYWHTNVGGTLALLDAMRATAVPRLVFSSTAATYGEPDEVPIQETAPTRPTNPYGASKLAVDMMITSEARAHGLGAVSLRYFNVAGASGGQGERHAVETHLIPIALQVVTGRAGRLRGVRRRLSDPGRHLHPGLRARGRPGRGAPAGAGRRPCRASTGSTTSATAPASRCRT